MSAEITVHKIGKVLEKDHRYILQLAPEFRDGLKSVSEFSHIHVVWWGHLSTDHRTSTLIQKPYKNGPAEIGVFATRSQTRPNPILITLCAVTKVDFERGEIEVAWIDAVNETPILDIKPYLACSDFSESTKTSSWSQHWPNSVEKSATFDWQSEFNF